MSIKHISIIAVISIGLASCGGDKPKAEEAAPEVANNNPSDVVTPQVENNNPAIQTDPQKQVSLDKKVNEGPVTTMTFKESSHNFGKVALKSENEHVFAFTNTGDVPLTIRHAGATCGCTVPEWPKEPIPPGQDGEIKVIFKPKDGQAGTTQKKTVTIQANVPGGTAQLNISADVAEK